MFICVSRSLYNHPVKRFEMFVCKNENLTQLFPSFQILNVLLTLSMSDLF